MQSTVHQLVRAFGRTLAQTEWLSPQDLSAYQSPLLCKLLSHARQTTDFYRDRFDFDVTSPSEVEMAWSAIPVITRAEAVENRRRLTSRSAPPEAGATHQGETSGSTGYPFSYLRSEISTVAAQALNERMMRWWGIDGSKAMARISFDRRGNAPPPAGALLSGWHTGHPSAAQHVLSTAADVEAQVDWLAARQPDYLSSYSSLLKEIALASRRLGKMLKFDLLLSFGTVVDEETREICRTHFGAEIVDTYGAEEIGHLAAQCRQCGEYHVSAEAVLLEVLRPDGSLAREGEIGRVVVTSLYNYAMPLIRYELGDLAQAGSERARCRRGLPSLHHILGRYRNVFRFPNGRIISPSAVRFGLKELPLRQVQIVQLDMGRIEIRWVPDGSGRPIDLAAVTERIRTVLGEPIEVSLRMVEMVERSPSGKFEDCVSLVPPD
jgi:phenylacetate-CoA ligase